MATVPRASVCIPTFNAGRFISATIQSVLGQTLSDFELVICDDASTDDTLERINEFNDARLRVVQNATNTGLSANWNRAVRECRAPYVKLLCQDDLIYPTCLEKQVAILSDPNHADIGLVCGQRDIIDESGRVRLHGRGRLPAGTTPGKDAIRQVVRSGTNPIGEPAAVMFRASDFNKAGPFDGSRPYMIDVDFWCKVLSISNLYAIPQSICAFRLSRNALSATMAKSQSRQARSFFASLAKAPNSPVTPTDTILGQVNATLLAPARRLVYRLLF
ncbi:MAG TPA: glycosyltransferase [Tepidisphaeraceae bacterium]|jgi:glycosyltransferase involved in cell wall biosynthesis